MENTSNSDIYDAHNANEQTVATRDTGSLKNKIYYKYINYKNTKYNKRKQP